MRRASLVPLVVLLAVPLAVSACAGGTGARHASPSAAAGTTSTTSPPEPALQVSAADVAHMGAQTDPVLPAVREAVLATLRTYLAQALVEPLRTGSPPAGVEALFTAAAVARLTGGDRASLVEDAPPIAGQVTQDKGDVRLTALAGPDGQTHVVAADLQIGLTASGPAGRLTTTRVGQLILVNDGGAWHIDAYDLRATNDSQPPLPPSTTTSTRAKR